LEEFTFSLRDDLESLDEVVKKEEAWSIMHKVVVTLVGHFETEAYENSPAETYRAKLEDIQARKTVFMVWLQKFNQKIEMERNIKVV
jgi:hypothetical protein